MTGVQTCALPIWLESPPGALCPGPFAGTVVVADEGHELTVQVQNLVFGVDGTALVDGEGPQDAGFGGAGGHVTHLVTAVHNGVGVEVLHRIGRRGNGVNLVIPVFLNIR